MKFNSFSEFSDFVNQHYEEIDPRGIYIGSGTKQQFNDDFSDLNPSDLRQIIWKLHQILDGLRSNDFSGTFRVLATIDIYSIAERHVDFSPPFGPDHEPEDIHGLWPDTPDQKEISAARFIPKGPVAIANTLDDTDEWGSGNYDYHLLLTK